MLCRKQTSGPNIEILLEKLLRWAFTPKGQRTKALLTLTLALVDFLRGVGEAGDRVCHLENGVRKTLCPLESLKGYQKESKECS